MSTFAASACVVSFLLQDKYKMYFGVGCDAIVCLPPTPLIHLADGKVCHANGRCEQAQQARGHASARGRFGCWGNARGVGVRGSAVERLENFFLIFFAANGVCPCPSLHYCTTTVLSLLCRLSPCVGVYLTDMDAFCRKIHNFSSARHVRV